ncbi:MAG TPA: acyltransferase [Dongiaceae bacterium]|nr:acyltransferase [Dongiaceae bacterium]
MIGASTIARDGAAPPRTGERAQRLSFFDGLRGVAALGVVLSHLFQHFYPPMHAPEVADPVSRLIGSTPLSAFYNGQFSVWIFFVLSGLVLSASVDRDRFPLAGTIVRRYVRLTLPILAITLLILLLAQGHLIATDRVVDSAPVAAALYPPDFAPGLGYWLSNGLFGVYLTGQSDFENVLWTMKVEIWGSLYVFLLWYFARNRRLRMGICAISFLALNELPDSSSFQGLQLFPVGILIYELAKSGFRGGRGLLFPTGIGILVLLIGIEFGAWRLKQPAIPGADVVAHGLHAVLPFISMNRGEAQQLGAVLVVAAIAMTPILQRLLSTRPFRFLGAVSFPLYLSHLPVLATAGCVIFAASYASWGAAVAALVTIPGTVLIALAVASILTVAVERPSIRLSHAVGRLARDWPMALWPMRRAAKG